jgi:DNA polymerase-3 subunit epsilon
VFVLNEFTKQIEQCHSLIAHNISFDEKIIGAEFLRNKMQNVIPTKKRICTMQGSKHYCAIKGPYGIKFPRLAELHYKLFNCNFDEAHDAGADINATAKCFWELKKRGIL